ncbi:hypothetical protein LU276_09520 [Moraxella haemolytica]|uniref:hypothetical protein n=1 Tax=Moraxella haemolytica TaxID=2904119 RepID=UPI002542BA05|nr:hypothetical protein [Moraxella sp. ZY171148]WII95216.1 hypothetical protein LU276_09520 [Moraxella sp. ZY171148]
MTLPNAYSLDLQKVINPKDADIAYQAGKIASQKNFTCPLCGIAVTCVNLSKPKNERKVEPHFRSVENHKIDCKLGKQENLAKINHSQSDNDSHYQNVQSGEILFDLTEPAPKKQYDDDLDRNSSQSIKRRSPKQNNNTHKRKINSRQRLSVIVSAFLNQENYLLTLPIPFQERKSLQDIFIEIAGQDLSELEDDCWRIYYGKAWVNEMDDGGFLIRFKDTLKDEELKINESDTANTVRPTFFIPKEMIEQTSFVKFSIQRMKQKTNKKLHQVFIMAHKPALNQTKEYINFILEGLAYLEILD